MASLADIADRVTDAAQARAAREPLAVVMQNVYSVDVLDTCRWLAERVNRTLLARGVGRRGRRAVLETMRWCGGYDPIERRRHRRCWAKAVREVTGCASAAYLSRLDSGACLFAAVRGKRPAG